VRARTSNRLIASGLDIFLVAEGGDSPPACVGTGSSGCAAIH